MYRNEAVGLYIDAQRDGSLFEMYSLKIQHQAANEGRGVDNPVRAIGGSVESGIQTGKRRDPNFRCLQGRAHRGIGVHACLKPQH